MLQHCSGESFFIHPNCRGHPVYAVALAAESEQVLLELEKELLENGIPHVAFREPDRPYFGQLMSIGFLPAEKEKLKQFTRRFSLLG